MALNDIIFVKGQGGLGRPLEGQDYISGLMIYTSSVPDGWDEPVLLTSLQDAENMGITNDYSDATSKTWDLVVDDAGDDGDVYNLSINTINNFGVEVTYLLASYTKVVGDADETAVATAITLLINSNSYVSGVTATSTGDTITLILPKRLGVYSATSITYNHTGNITITPSTQVAGTFSKLAVWHYHISEFFRIQPKGELWLDFSDSNAYDFSEVQYMQNVSGGKIRQLGVLAYERSYTASDTTTLQSVCNTLASLHKPLSVILSENIVELTLAQLDDLSTFSNNNTSVVIGQDGGGQGNYLFLTNGGANTIGTLGATLGAVSLSKVSEDIAWISKFNMSSGTELDKIGFGNGDTMVSVSQNMLNNLDNKRYLFLVKYVGIAGSYFNDSHCAVSVTSDYAYIENNRTIDKAIRGVYSSMLPNLNSPLELNGDGTLKDTTIAYFESQASINLDQMVRDTELSAFSVLIDSTQNVLSTSTLYISIKLVPIGVARNIVVNIGFSLSI